MDVEYDKAIVNETCFNFLKEIEKIIGSPIPMVDKVVWKEIDKKGSITYKSKFGFSVNNGNITGLGLKHQIKVEKNIQKFFPNPLKNLPDSISELKDIKNLDLSGNELNSLPESISKLENLEFLDLSRNSYHFKELPKSIGELKNLKYLDISGNAELPNIPESIGNLSKLEVLILSGNGSITTFPDSMGKLSNLKDLVIERMGNIISLPESLGDIKSLINFKIIRNGNLKSIPDSIGKNLHLLDEFSIIGNGKLENLPKSIGEMKKLKVLNISSNKSLQSLPDSIGDLENLRILDLSKNNLKILPDSLGNLTKLVNLDVSNNNLKELPGSLGLIKTLKIIQTDNNQWDNEHKSIVKKSIHDLLDYLRRKSSIYVFFSHAVQDFEQYQIDKICEYLEQHNEIYKVFYCERDMTGDIDEFMKTFISKCQILLFLGTKKSIYNSQDCRFELKEAEENGLEIIPIKGVEIDWSDFKEVELDRKLGIEFTNEDIENFNKNLLDHILKIKKEKNLFDKYEEQLNQIKDSIKGNLVKFIENPDFNRLIEENQNAIFGLNADYKELKLDEISYFNNLFKILFRSD